MQWDSEDEIVTFTIPGSFFSPDLLQGIRPVHEMKNIFRLPSSTTCSSPSAHWPHNNLSKLDVTFVTDEAIVEGVNDYVPMIEGKTEITLWFYDKYLLVVSMIGQDSRQRTLLYVVYRTLRIIKVITVYSSEI